MRPTRSSTFSASSASSCGSASAPSSPWMCAGPCRHRGRPAEPSCRRRPECWRRPECRTGRRFPACGGVCDRWARGQREAPPTRHAAAGAAWRGGRPRTPFVKYWQTVKRSPMANYSSFVEYWPADASPLPGRPAPVMTQDLAGWGNYPRVAVRQIAPPDRAATLAALAAEPALIARGNGRAYGDAALNPRATLTMLGNRGILAFDPGTGRITVEAGLLLGDLIAAILPHGWFVPVTPGTKFVSIGGAVAADVHGKNHHVAGSFSAHVEALELALADGRVLACSPAAHA